MFRAVFRKREPLVSPHAVAFNAPEEQRQIRHGDLNRAGLWRDDGKPEDSGFEPLIKNDEAVIVPEQELQPVASPIAKHEQVPAQWIAAQLIAHDPGQAVERKMEIDGGGMKVDFHERR
jgi:hypothetical protein